MILMEGQRPPAKPGGSAARESRRATVTTLRCKQFRVCRRTPPPRKMQGKRAYRDIAADARQGRLVSHRREVRHRFRIPRRPARGRATAYARDPVMEPARLARQHGHHARPELLLPALDRERHRPRAQRIRAPDARLQGHQPRDLPGPRVRRTRLRPGLGHVVPAPLRFAGPEGQDLGRGADARGRSLSPAAARSAPRR